MSYYPILQAPGCTGFTTLCNFSPNNWESGQELERHVVLSHSDGECWRHASLGKMKAGEIRTFVSADVASRVAPGVLPLLSLFEVMPPAATSRLPVDGMPHATVPAWRATLGLSSGLAQTCYQGEVDPFPPAGSLLTFCPFLQSGEDLENSMLFLNLERDPRPRKAVLEVRDSLEPARLYASFDLSSNALNQIPLDDLGIEPDRLPLILCRNMAGIPLYFTRSLDGAGLSLEHTHPPASLVIHGRRWEAQKLLKSYWFDRASS